MATNKAANSANTKVVDLTSLANGDRFFELHGWAVDELKAAFDVTYSRDKTKLSISGPDKQKYEKAARITRMILSRQASGRPVTKKYVQDLINEGEKPQAETKTVIKNNGDTVTQAIKDHSLQIEIDLENGRVIHELMNGDKRQIKMLEAIFDTRIATVKNTLVSIKPNGKETRKPQEVAHNKLLVSQTANVLSNLAKALAANELMSDKTLSLLVMTAVSGASNEEKTRSRILRQFGAMMFPQLADNENVETPAMFKLTKTRNDRYTRHIKTEGDFGGKFEDDLAIKGIFQRKLMMEIDYHGGKGEKRLALTKKKGCTVTHEQAFKVVEFAQEKYFAAQNTLNAALIDNAVDNLLAGRPLDYLADEKRADMEQQEKLQQYRLSTYNATQKDGFSNGNPNFMYPNSPSQFHMLDLMFGEPSKNPQVEYHNKGARIGFLIGPAGTGKTAMGVWGGVHAFKQNWAKNIYFLRPNVGSNGKPPPLVPGDMRMKSASGLAPIYENLEKVMPNEIAMKYVREPLPPGTPQPPGVDINRKIEIGDADMYRGRTIDGFAYIDEAQNLTRTQMKTLMTRGGKGSHINFSIDLDQIDLPNKALSGGPAIVIMLHEAMQAKRNKLIKGVVCNGQSRDDAVDEALDMWHAFETNNKETTREKRFYTWENQYETALMIYYGTTDAAKVKQIRENEIKYGFDETGYSPMAANKRDVQIDSKKLYLKKDRQPNRVIDLQTAKQEMDITKVVKTMAGELIGELIKQGVLKVG